MDRPGSPYQIELSPHIHSGITKDGLMARTFLAMCVPAVAAGFAMGTDALIHIVLAVGTSLVCRLLITALLPRGSRPQDDRSAASPLVAGMIVGLSMPIASPYPLTVGVSALTMTVFKWLQGRAFGRKYVNPAAASKLVLLGGLTLAAGLGAGMLFYPGHLRLDLWSAAGFDRVIEFYETQRLSGIESLILWKTHGWIGGASGLAVLVAGVGVVIWLKLKWRIVLSLFLVIGSLAILVGALTGGDVVGRLVFHLFTGSVVFMGFFMATEPQSTPMTDGGQCAFGALLGVGTFLLQQMNVLGGSIIALVAMNLLTPFFDRIGMRRPYGHGGGR